MFGQVPLTLFKNRYMRLQNKSVELIQCKQRSSLRIDLCQWIYTTYSVLQCQSSSGSIVKSIIPFRRPRFKPWLDRVVFFFHKSEDTQQISLQLEKHLYKTVEVSRDDIPHTAFYDTNMILTAIYQYPIINIPYVY